MGDSSEEQKELKRAIRPLRRTFSKHEHRPSPQSGKQAGKPEDQPGTDRAPVQKLLILDVEAGTGYNGGI